MKNIDFEIVEVEGRKALLKLLELRDELPGGGKYPFIIGAQKSLEMLTEIYEYQKRSADEIIRQSLGINAEQLFEERRKDALPDETETEFDLAALTGEWAERASAREIGLTFDDLLIAHTDILSREPFEKCFIGLAPTAESWQVPAFVRFGGWNDCPEPAQHCALLRYWQTKYGAEIVSLTGDVIECRVAEPPQAEAECFALAWQQYAYCADIVDQGVGSIGALASGLRDSDYWYFWWD